MLVILGDSRKLKFHNLALQEIHLPRKVLQSDSQLSRDLTPISSINWQSRLVYTKVHLLSHSRSKLRGGGDLATAPMPQPVVNLHRPLAFAHVRLTIKAARNRLVSTAESLPFVAVTKRSLCMLRLYLSVSNASSEHVYSTYSYTKRICYMCI